MILQTFSLYLIRNTPHGFSYATSLRMKPLSRKVPFVRLSAEGAFLIAWDISYITSNAIAWADFDGDTYCIIHRLFSIVTKYKKPDDMVWFRGS